MLAPLFLLALLIIPSALQQETETVSQKFAKLGGWLERWRDQSVDSQVLIVSNQGAITSNQQDLEDTLAHTRAEAAGVKAQLEELLVDFTELVKIGQVIQNVTSQLLIDLQVLKGRQAVGGAVQGGQVFMFLAYLVTIAVFYLVRHCRKHQEKVARTEFELLETKLQASRSKRRAAAARAGKQSPQ